MSKLNKIVKCKENHLFKFGPTNCLNYKALFPALIGYVFPVLCAPKQGNISYVCKLRKLLYSQ